MERVIDVANYICDKYQEKADHFIDEMKLHKLLYFAQRESIAITGEPLFEETFEGWKYGPVCVPIRRVFTINGLQAEAHDIDTQTAYILNNVIYQYGQFASWKLVDMTHQEISWINSRKGLNPSDFGDKELELSDIKEDAKKVRPYDSLYDMYYDEFEDLEESI